MPSSGRLCSMLIWVVPSGISVQCRSLRPSVKFKSQWASLMPAVSVWNQISMCAPLSGPLMAADIQARAVMVDADPTGHTRRELFFSANEIIRDHVLTPTNIKASKVCLSLHNIGTVVLARGGPGVGRAGVVVVAHFHPVPKLVESGQQHLGCCFGLSLDVLVETGRDLMRSVIELEYPVAMAAVSYDVAQVGLSAAYRMQQTRRQAVSVVDFGDEWPASDGPCVLISEIPW